LEGWVVASQGTPEDPCSTRPDAAPKQLAFSYCGAEAELCVGPTKEGRQLRQIVSDSNLTFYRQPCEDRQYYAGSASACSVLQVSPGSKGIAPSRCPSGSATAGDYDTCWIWAQLQPDVLQGWVMVSKGGPMDSLCYPSAPGAQINSTVSMYPGDKCLGERTMTVLAPSTTYVLEECRRVPDALGLPCLHPKQLCSWPCGPMSGP
jgi:hypothetical protein